jgi:D-alanyl-D-alanine carboxypeptidase
MMVEKSGHQGGCFGVSWPRKLIQLGLMVVLVLVLVLARAQADSPRYAGLVMEADTGRVLSAVNPDDPRYPASLTKLMTLYLTFEALRDRRITLDELVPVSAHAASMEPTKLGLVPGIQITVQQAILGLVTKSANDAASALGELLGGTEDRFGEMMTLRAHALGMAHTTFRNASGLPDPEQITTARDIAILARHLVKDFPTDYGYFSTPYFVFHGHTIMNHDRMLQTYPGADGMKTGYTQAAGHNLVTSAMRGGVRLIGVVLGSGSNGERDVQMRAQLDDGFEQMDVPVVREVVATRRVPTLIQRADAATIPRAEAATVMRQANAADHGMADWAVQVGVFGNEAAARRAAATAHLAGEQHVETLSAHGHTMWRAQVTGLHRNDALEACSARLHRHEACTVLAPSRMASR